MSLLSKHTIRLVKVGNAPLTYQKPPAISLATNNEKEILAAFYYLGMEYKSKSAFNLALNVFKFSRDFILNNSIDKITLDWDHTLSNYLVYEDVLALSKSYLYKTRLPKKIAEAKMTALEVARPYMHELVLGLMFGFALKQNISLFTQWENYTPKVFIATLTWPERIGMLTRHFPLLPLMAGTTVGNDILYENIMDDRQRVFIHLHHFLDYANTLFQKTFRRDGNN